MLNHQIARRDRWLVALTLLALAPVSTAHGATRSWDNGGTNQNWSNNLNWTNNLVPTSADDVLIGNLAAAANVLTQVNQDFTILSLALSNGADVNTGGFTLLVNGGPTTLTGAGTWMFVAPNASNPNNNSLDVDSLTINSGASIGMQGGVLEVDSGKLDINAGGILSGYGRIDLEATGGIVMFENDGTISVSRSLFGPTNPELVIRRTGAGNGTIDLDGLNGNGVLDVDDVGKLEANLSLVIDGPLSDAFSGTIHIGRDDQVRFVTSWSASGATINLNGGAGAASLLGAALTASTTNLNVNSGTAVIAAPLTLNSGAIAVANNATLRLDAFTHIANASNYSPGSNTALIVNALVNMGDNVVTAGEYFDWDGTSGGRTIINSDGRLVINAERLEPGTTNQNRFDGFLTMNGGSLSVNVLGAWQMNGSFSMNNPGDGRITTLSGSSLTIGDDSGGIARLDVVGSGVHRINWDGPSAAITFHSDARVHVADGATLRIERNAGFLGVNGAARAQFTGDGTIILAGQNNYVFEETTINMPNGRVDLDGDFIAGDVFLIGDLFDLNVAAIGVSSIGASDNTFRERLGIASTGRLRVNLTNPTAEWTLAPGSMLDVIGPGATPSVSIEGSGFNLNGSSSISGRTDWNAQVDVAGTISIAANGWLRLTGGSAANPNRLLGGTVNGDGTLFVFGDALLVGSGTINADVQVTPSPGAAAILADNGTLTVNGSFVATKTGTADSDGVLNVTQPWQIAGNGIVELKGGEVTGGVIRNRGGVIRGFGRITSAGGGGGDLFNNGLIEAQGGTLELATSINLAGEILGILGPGKGSFTAVQGDLLISKAAVSPFPASFVGTMNIGAGRSITYETGGTNDRLLFDDAADDLDALGNVGRLNLSGGTLVADIVDLEGHVAVSAAPSTIEASQINFRNVGTNSINNELRLDGATLVEASASFSGSGKLVNMPGNPLSVRGGNRDLGVGVENRGALNFGNHGSDPHGTLTLSTFTQTASGSLRLTGILGSGDYDRIHATGAAQLGGSLIVENFGSYESPSEFTLITTGGGVQGTFDDLVLPPAAPDVFRIRYEPNAVILTVGIEDVLNGDLNGDGVVDGDDLTYWLDSFGVNMSGDVDGDGDTDGDDFLAWQRQLGSGPPATPAQTGVPEPSGLALAALAALAAATRRGTLRRSIGASI